MGRHSLVRESKRRGAARTALVVGAVAGTAAIPVASAMAQTISIPGAGNVDVPEVPQNVQQQLLSPQVQGLIHQAPPQMQQTITQVVNQITHAAIPAPAPAPAPQSVGLRALQAAQSRIGTPYVWGGQAPGGFDCSGLVKWSYAQAGIEMPRTSFEQAQVGRPVPLDQMQPGDVVIMNGGNHAALYAGNGKILQASTFGEPVDYGSLHDGSVYTVRRL